MSTKRVSLVTVNSLTALSKVCSSSRHSSDSIKALNLSLKHLSTVTVTAGILDSRTHNGHHVENSSEYYQNPTPGLNSYMGFEPKSNPSESFRESPANDYYVKNTVLGQKDGSSNGFQWQNSNGVYRESFASENPNSFREHFEQKPKPGERFRESPANYYYAKSPVLGQKDGSANGFQWQNLNGVDRESFASENQNSFRERFEQKANPSERFKEIPANDYYVKNPVLGQKDGSSNGFQWQNSNGVYRESFASENHNSTTVGTNGKFNGYYSAQNNYNHNGVCLEQNANEFHQDRNGFYGESTRNKFQNNSFDQNVSFSGTYGYNNKTLQQNPSASAEQYQLPANPKAEAQEESTKADSETLEPKYIVTIEELNEFCKQGKLKEAVKILGLLENSCVPVDLPIFLQLMRVCGEAEALQEAKAVHEHIMRSLSPLKVSTYNEILEMYSKCGSMGDAFCVFNKMPERNLTTWDTMITWLAKNGLGEDAIDLFTQFKKAGFKPDSQMFIGVFSACTVLGDIDEGLLHFESMCKDYGIIPSMGHYVSVVHMLGSTGYLDEALEFIEKMPEEPTVDVWETLMNLCRLHGNLELGDRCAEIVENLDSSRLNEQSKVGLVPVKADRAKKEQKKKLSQNPLEIRSRVHEYRAGDTSHPENDRIYAMLKGLKEQMKEAGYIPETRFVLHDIDQESKEDALLAHSERLASAYGLLTSPARSPIRVIKNLRVCGDCHSALKIISKIVGRELIMRDAKRFHHFKDGVCSCRDYW